MESLFVLTAVAGATECIRRAQKGDVKAVATILTAAAIGGLAGLAGVEGLTLFTGVVAGLSASGLVTVASKVRG